MDDRLALYVERLPKGALIRQWIVAFANSMIVASFATAAVVVVAKGEDDAALAVGVTGALVVTLGAVAAWNVSGLIKASGRSVPAVIVVQTDTGYRFATPVLKTWRNRDEFPHGSKVRINCVTVDGSQWRGSVFLYKLWTEDATAGFWTSAPLAKDSIEDLRRLIESRGGTLESSSVRPRTRRRPADVSVSPLSLTPAVGAPASTRVTLAGRDITLVPLGGEGETKPGWPERLRDEDAVDHFLSVEAPRGSTVTFVATLERPTGLDLAATRDFGGWTRLVSLLDDGTGLPLHIATDAAVRGATFFTDASARTVVLYLHRVE